jgi:hypothetical protein
MVDRVHEAPARSVIIDLDGQHPGLVNFVEWKFQNVTANHSHRNSHFTHHLASMGDF